MVKTRAFERFKLIGPQVETDINNSLAPVKRVVENANNVTVELLHLNQELLSQLLDIR